MSASLAELVAGARCLLVDFDGPICSIFAGRPATEVAASLHVLIRRHFGGHPPRLSSDPLKILVEVAALGDERLTRQVAAACRDEELAAIDSATPTPGGEDVLRAAHDAGFHVAVVSNNSGEAVDAYLKQNDLVRYVDVLAARVGGMHPRLLKPHPFLLERAVAPLVSAIFVGDSVTDIEAGRAAGIPTIGYANKPGKHLRLTEARAAVVIDSMDDLAAALLQIQPTNRS